MAILKSATVDDFQRLEGPSKNVRYPHPAETRRRGIPLAFQVTSPFDDRLALLPHALVMHVNPSEFTESHTKKIERLQTRGGFVEQHWGDDLTEISCSGSTGAFINLYTGMSSLVRQKTIAWDRYRDLYDLYRNNGSVYDPFGNIVLQGKVQLLYDRGAFIGTFRSFDVEETAESPFTFNLSWMFKVEFILAQIPGGRARGSSIAGLAKEPDFDLIQKGQNALQFQSLNLQSLVNGKLTEPPPFVDAELDISEFDTPIPLPANPISTPDPGKSQYRANPPAGYGTVTSNIPSNANAQAKLSLGKGYGTQTPFTGTNGKEYVAIVESHFDDHVTPQGGWPTGPDGQTQKYKFWHKGVSIFVKKGG